MVNIRWKRILVALAVAAIMFLSVWVWVLTQTLASLENAYKHPKVEERVRVERVKGPVRTVTKIVEVAGRKEILIEEVRGPVTEVVDGRRISEPMFPPLTRTSRWIAGFAVDPLVYSDFRRWELLGGYSFFNRLDLLGGVTGRGQSRVQVQIRFN